MVKKVEGEAFADEELAGLSPEERAALEGEDTEQGDLETIAAGTEAAGEDEENVDDPAAKEAAEKARLEAEATKKAEAEEKARVAAEQKAEAAAKKKRDAELAAMDEEERKAAEAEDKAKAEATAKAKADADAKAKEEAERKRKEEEARTAAGVDDEDDEPLIVTYDAKPPEKYDEQVKALDARKAESTAKYKAGTIELEDMLAEHGKADEERRKLDAQMTKAEIAAEQNEQAASRRWFWEVGRFMRDTAKHDGIDYRVYEGCPDVNKRLNAAWDDTVKELANDPANKERPGKWFLVEAHKRVKAAFNLTGGKPAESADAAKVAAEKKRVEDEAKRLAAEARRKNAKLPKNLGDLPAAAASDIGTDHEGEFAHLDGLGGMELEVAVAKLTPDQQDRWARM